MILMLLSLLFIEGCGNSKELSIPPLPTDGKIPIYKYEVVNNYPHDPKAYTQGLQFHNGYLYESTGENGESSVRQVEVQTGKVLKSTPLAHEFFGEGLTIMNGKAYQLTWENHKAFVYDLNTLERKGEFSFPKEGWGLTNDGTNLIASDGTNNIYFLNPENFQFTSSFAVENNGQPVDQLNELEYIKGEIWANIWHTNMIVRLDPKSRKIVAWVDLNGLRPQETYRDNEAVLNGIAYDEQNDRLFVTGKRWPKVYEIRLKQK